MSIVLLITANAIHCPIRHTPRRVGVAYLFNNLRRIVVSQNPSQTPQHPLVDTQIESRLPLPTRTTTDWETPEAEEFELCFEITAYVYHWE
jgi:coenzyme PQQ precursor peptide PqqA